MPNARFFVHGSSLEINPKSYVQSVPSVFFDELLVDCAPINLIVTCSDVLSSWWSTLSIVCTQVFFTELKRTYTESTPAYTFLALMCDIGGALGLVLGSTMLTFCELADVAAVAAFKLFTAHRNRSRRVSAGVVPASD